MRNENNVADMESLLECVNNYSSFSFGLNELQQLETNETQTGFVFTKGFVLNVVF